jgi:phospholipid/cholesterol/gamma-HCH transport system substrate-binding protein
MRKETETEIKVGLFVTIGIGLIMLAILVLGGANSIFSRRVQYTMHFPSAEGLIEGAKVVLGGLTVGQVADVAFDRETKNVKVTVAIERKHAEWLRKDSTGEIATQGLLGDKFVSISTGTEEAGALPAGAEIPNHPSKDITQFLGKSDQLLASLNGIASSLDRILKQFETNNRSEQFFQGMAVTSKQLAQASTKLNEELSDLALKKASKNLASVLEKINNGTGTLGALVNDPALYDDVRALMGGANRNRVMRNLVRKTIKDAEEAQAAGTGKK